MRRAGRAWERALGVAFFCVCKSVYILHYRFISRLLMEMNKE